ncbi:unnamed protein product [Allacma fusca]|uniref:Uncharacterized protein n=2 Tax=Allacma fusca TaxID=39272 RepID=A0A8J2PAZ1_9HEXA|nr:unnamed protein product [Allacma fusca]
MVRREILNILRGSLVVGYDLRQEFKAFEFTGEISAASVRDAGVAKMFMTRKQPPATGWEHPSLPDLVAKHLHLEMRDCRDAVECATATMALYKKYRHLAPAGWYRRQRKSQFPLESDLES